MMPSNSGESSTDSLEEHLLGPRDRKEARVAKAMRRSEFQPRSASAAVIPYAFLEDDETAAGPLKEFDVREVSDGETSDNEASPPRETSARELSAEEKRLAKEKKDEATFMAFLAEFQDKIPTLVIFQLFKELDRLSEGPRMSIKPSEFFQSADFWKILLSKVYPEEISTAEEEIEMAGIVNAVQNGVPLEIFLTAVREDEPIEALLATTHAECLAERKRLFIEKNKAPATEEDPAPTLDEDAEEQKLLALAEKEITLAPFSLKEEERAKIYKNIFQLKSDSMAYYCGTQWVCIGKKSRDRSLYCNEYGAFTCNDTHHSACLSLFQYAKTGNLEGLQQLTNQVPFRKEAKEDEEPPPPISLVALLRNYTEHQTFNSFQFFNAFLSPFFWICYFKHQHILDEVYRIKNRHLQREYFRKHEKLAFNPDFCEIFKWAVLCNQIDAIKILRSCLSPAEYRQLLENFIPSPEKTSPEKAYSNEESLLHIACYYGHKEALDALLEGLPLSAPAIILGNCDRNSGEKKLHGPLNLASLYNHSDIVLFLSGLKAPLECPILRRNAIVNNGLQTLQILLKTEQLPALPDKIFVLDREGQSPLQIAANRGRSKIALLLLSYMTPAQRREQLRQKMPRTARSTLAEAASVTITNKNILQLFLYAAPELLQDKELMLSIGQTAVTYSNSNAIRALVEMGVDFPEQWLSGQFNCGYAITEIHRLKELKVGQKAAQATLDASKKIKASIIRLIEERDYEGAFKKIAKFEMTGNAISQKILLAIISGLLKARVAELQEGGSRFSLPFKKPVDNFLMKGERLLKPPRGYSIEKLLKTYGGDLESNPYLSFLAICMLQAKTLYQADCNSAKPLEANDCEAIKTLVKIILVNPLIFKNYFFFFGIAPDESSFYEALNEALKAKHSSSLTEEKRNELREISEKISEDFRSLRKIEEFTRKDAGAATGGADSGAPAGPAAAPVAADLEARRDAAAATVTPAAVAAVAAGAGGGFLGGLAAKASRFAGEAKMTLVKFTTAKTDSNARNVNSM